MKTTATAVLLILASAASAAVPLRWTVDTSRFAPAAFDAVRGETLELEATFNSYGKPLSRGFQGPVKLYVQTNGMADAWWEYPATATSNRIAATFSPSMDPGAGVLVGFLGSTGTSYRAAFTLRFRHGPGAVPNAIEQPPKVLDLSRTVVINPPWPTDETIAGRIRAIIAEDGVSTTETDPTVPEWAKQPYPPIGGHTDEEIADIAGAKINAAGCVTTNAGGAVEFRSNDREYWSGGDINITPGGNTLIPEIEIGSNGGGQARLKVGPSIELYTDVFDHDIKIGNDGCGGVLVRRDINELKDTAGRALSYSSRVYNYAIGNTNAWFSGEHYYSETGVPCNMNLMEIRGGRRQKVWDEKLFNQYMLFGFWYGFDKWTGFDSTNDLPSGVYNELAASIPRKAYSWYDSLTGTEMATNTTLYLGNQEIVFSGGAVWEKSVTAGGACWIWQVKGEFALGEAASTSGSFIALKDFEGKEIFRVRKTDAEDAAAVPSSVRFDASRGAYGEFTVEFLSTDTQPQAYVRTSLLGGAFDETTREDSTTCPAAVTWSRKVPGDNASAWVCHAELKAPTSAIFLKAMYLRPGESVIQQAVPIDPAAGILCTDGHHKVAIDWNNGSPRFVEVR